MEFEKGEVVEWLVENKNKLILRRTNNTKSTTKKTEPKSLIEKFDFLLSACNRAFKQARTFYRASQSHLRSTQLYG